MYCNNKDITRATKYTLNKAPVLAHVTIRYEFDGRYLALVRPENLPCHLADREHVCICQLPDA